MLADLLKNDTLTQHQQLEKLLIGRMKAMLTTQDYIDLLQLFYSYFGGLEQQIDLHLDQSLLPDYAQRRKSAALAHDIDVLGGKPSPLANAVSLPVISNNIQAMAALYVIEGSTLGGKFISKMIAKQLNIANDQGLSFFNSYGENTAEMWEKFKQVLNDKQLSAGLEAQIIDTANETFAKFSAWVQKFTK